MYTKNNSSLPLTKGSVETEIDGALPSKEREIIEWLLKNKEDIKDRIKQIPSFNRECIVDFVKREIEHSIHLNPEEINNITLEFISNIFRKE